MRGFISFVLLSLSAFHVSSALAGRRGLNARSSSDVAIVRRQRHVNRSLVDVCADVDLAVILLPLLGDIFGHVCLCLSAFPLNLEADIGLKVDLASGAKVEALLEAFIGNSGNKCTYPTHAQQLCSSGNPCGFSCESGYTKQGNQCVCMSPYIECNGKCGSYPRGCSSAVPRSLQDQHRITRPTTLEDAQATCGTEQVCGVYSKPDGYECVNTKTNRESCGGCVVPSPFSSQVQSPPGTDCSSIMHSLDASCVSGRCVVHRCADSYQINSKKDGCV